MLDEKIQLLIEEQNRFKGIDTRKLPKGTKFLVKTRNTDYIIENIDQNGSILIQGGKFVEPTEGKFVGSTFGSSMIKMGWIGYRMYMEFFINNNTITTSGVRAAKIVTTNWEYEMEWNQEENSENKAK